MANDLSIDDNEVVEDAPSQEWDDDREEVDGPADLLYLQDENQAQNIGGNDEDEIDIDAMFDNDKDDNDEQGADGDDDDDDNDKDGPEKEDNPEYYYNFIKNMWKQELASPEILPWFQDEVDLATNALEQQEENIAQINDSDNVGDIEALMGSILKVDSDRTKFMLSDLMRTRLMKIQEHPLYLDAEEMDEILSDNELKFLEQYKKLVGNHMNSTVLDHISKEAWSRLDSEGMVDKPDLEQFVFAKMKETCEIDVGTEDAPKVEHQAAGKTIITRYSTVKDLYWELKVELCM